MARRSVTTESRQAEHRNSCQRPRQTRRSPRAGVVMPAVSPSLARATQYSGRGANPGKVFCTGYPKAIRQAIASRTIEMAIATFDATPPRADKVMPNSLNRISSGRGGTYASGVIRLSDLYPRYPGALLPGAGLPRFRPTIQIDSHLCTRTFRHFRVCS